MGGICYNRLDFVKNVEIVSERHQNTNNSSIPLAGKLRQDQLSKSSSRASVHNVKKKNKKNITYTLEYKYTEPQIVKTDECFYVKNINPNKRRKIEYKPKGKIKFNDLLSKETEVYFDGQLKKHNDLEKVMDEISIITNIILTPIKYIRPNDDDPIEY